MSVEDNGAYENIARKKNESGGWEDVPGGCAHRAFGVGERCRDNPCKMLWGRYYCKKHRDLHW